MSEATLLFVAMGIALLMAAFATLNTHPNLLAAVRTTVVLVLAWSFACTLKPGWTFQDLSVHVRLMLALSLIAVATAWCLYFKGRHASETPVGSLVDRINVGFALLFAILLVSGGFASAPAVLLIIVGTLILASNRR